MADKKKTYREVGEESVNAVKENKRAKEAALANIFGEAMEPSKAAPKKKRKVKDSRPLKEQFPAEHKEYVLDPKSDDMSFAEWLGL